jgi:hypothetical protein
MVGEGAVVGVGDALKGFVAQQATHFGAFVEVGGDPGADGALSDVQLLGDGGGAQAVAVEEEGLVLQGQRGNRGGRGGR